MWSLWKNEKFVCELFYKLGMDKTSIFITKARVIHGDKYDYSLVSYITNIINIKIICRKDNHGVFEQLPKKHLEGHGCLKCAGLYVPSTEEFIQQAILVHGDKYDYSLVLKYVNNRVKIKIICKKDDHDIFEQSPGKHLQGQGCNKCGIIISSMKLRKTTNKFIQDAIKIHGDKYDYTNVFYTNSSTKVTIVCSLHGPFSQSPPHHLKGQGCNKCLMCPSCMLWRTKGGLCVYCKPKNQNKLYFKTKEMKVVQYLRDNLPNENFIHNKSVGSTCTGGHLFPDILFECSCYNIIVEIDEFKHRGASYACDEQRMYDIIAKLGMPCIFIRYNPDHKDSNMEDLLEVINEYLLFQYDEEFIEENAIYEYGWNKYGFDCHYMFYY